MERVTLHFDLSHLGHLHAHQDFTLKIPGARTVLARHDAQTRRHHAGLNTALAQLSDEHLARFTHFAETVSLPTDAISFCWVGYPSRRPGAVSDESAVIFQHVPTDAVRRAVRTMRRDGDLPTPSRLHPFGVAIPSDHADGESLHVDASLLLSPISSAMTMVMQHPDFGTLVPEDYCQIAEKLIAKQPSFTELWSYLSQNPEGTDNPWYELGHVTDADGKPVQPDWDLTDDDGNSLWPTKIVGGEEVRVIPQQTISDKLDPLLRRVLQDVGRVVAKESNLKGRQWSTQHGVTGLARTNVAAVQGQPAAEQDPARTHWTIVNKSSSYGLDLYQDSIEFSDATQTLTFKVRNWPNRGLGVYVQFLDADDKPMKPKGWQDRLADWPSDLNRLLQPNPTKQYLQHLGGGNSVFGIPVWAKETPVSFTVPAGATGATVLFGGLGNGDRDSDVDTLGLIYTCVVSYGIPSFLAVLSVGVKSTAWYKDYVDGNLVLQAMIGAGAVTLKLTLSSWQETLAFATHKFAGILFSKGLEGLAKRITGYVTAMEIADNAPFVGWALRVASVAGAVANMTATSIAVGLSPATYQLEAKRSMTLNISVGPDTKHGIWPESADHFLIDVRYRGGTTLSKSGRTPGKTPTPITVTYSAGTGDAVPSAPTQQFQIVASVYSASNWLCGKWVSEWIWATPNDGNSRTVQGFITEQVVPLTPDTQYAHTTKIQYDTAAKTYRWPDSAPAPQQTASSLSQPGQDLVQLTGMTVNDPAHRLAYCYQAKNQNLPMDDDSRATSTAMHVFRSISTLAVPGDGMLSPGRGFSSQPAIAYDQFGSETADGVTTAGSYNFYLDTRTYASCGRSQLRQVDLSGHGDSTFRYDQTTSWGSFALVHHDAMVVHPNGYVIAVASQDDKLAIVQLPATGVADADAPEALPFCGTGLREGLLSRPVSLAVTVDGRILVLEAGSARIQAFDTQANPVQCFAGTLDFVLDISGLAAQLDSSTVAPSLLQALQANIPVWNRTPNAYDPRHLSSPVFSIPAGFVPTLDAGQVTPDLITMFEEHGLTLSDKTSISRSAQGIWLLGDSETGINYDVRFNGEELNKVDIYRCFTPTILTKAPGAEWLLMDKTHTMSFAVTAQQGSSRLRFRGLTALMPLKDGPQAKVTYLDIAVEAKGFIYVLSYVNDGANPSDYRLDIYGPDGAPLNAGRAAHHGHVNAARMTVDRWRTLFTLNYEQMRGRDGRMEPTVSKWNPPPPELIEERNE